MPQLEREYNHSLRSVLSHLAQVTQDEEAYWSQEVARHVSAWSVREGQSVILEAGRLAAAPPALARRILRHIVEVVKGNRCRIDFDHIEAVLRLCRRAEGDGSVDLPGLTVDRSFDWLRFSIPHPAENWLRFVLGVSVPGTTELPDGSLLSTATIRREDRYNEGNTDCVDAALIRGSLSVRNWQPGDRLQSDAGRLRKLKDLFQQARIPHWDRQGWPVVTDGEKIIWTRKFGVSSAYRPCEHTQKLICFTWEKAHGESNISGPASNQ